MEHGSLPFIRSHIYGTLGRFASRGSSFLLSLNCRLDDTGLSLYDGEEPSLLFQESFICVRDALFWMWPPDPCTKFDRVPSPLISDKRTLHIGGISLTGLLQDPV